MKSNTDIPPDDILSVYVVTLDDGRTTKIGASARLKQRLEVLSFGGKHVPVAHRRIVHVYPSPLAPWIEARLHDHLASWRIEGKDREWYRLDADQLAALPALIATIEADAPPTDAGKTKITPTRVSVEHLASYDAAYSAAYRASNGEKIAASRSEPRYKAERAAYDRVYRAEHKAERAASKRASRAAKKAQSLAA